MSLMCEPPEAGCLRSGARSGHYWAGRHVVSGIFTLNRPVEHWKMTAGDAGCWTLWETPEEPQTNAVFSAACCLQYVLLNKQKGAEGYGTFFIIYVCIWYMLLIFGPMGNEQPTTTYCNVKRMFYHIAILSSLFWSPCYESDPCCLWHWILSVNWVKHGTHCGVWWIWWMQSLLSITLTQGTWNIIHAPRRHNVQM